MTEAEWATCENPKAMLAFVADQRQASPRLYRLFACACCRRAWHLLSSDPTRAAVAVTERHADGLATDEELEAAQAAAARVQRLGGVAAQWASARVARTGALLVVDAAGQLAACPPGQEYDPALWAAETPRQCDLLRDLCGPLPSRPVALETPWQTAEVLDLARRIYEERDVARMVELGQALYRAGCSNRDMLQHCLWSGEHARGCWVVDLVLGKDRGSAQ